jgi:hypothetical protein
MSPRKLGPPQPTLLDRAFPSIWPAFPPFVKDENVSFPIFNKTGNPFLKTTQKDNLYPIAPKVDLPNGTKQEW